MKNKFNEIRIFLGNETVGHDYSYVEFVFDTCCIREWIRIINSDKRVKFSRAKSGEFVFEPKNIIDFSNALKRTKFKDEIGASVYDEAPLLMQDLNNSQSKVYYIKDEFGMNAKELIEFISRKYYGDKINPELYKTIIEDCKKLLNVNKR